MIGVLIDALLPWLGWAVGALAAAGGLFVAGRHSGTKSAKAERAEANVEAGKEAKDNRHEIESSDDKRLTDILTGRVRE